MAKKIENGVVVDTSTGLFESSVEIPDELEDFSSIVSALDGKVDVPETPVAFTQTYSTAVSTVPAEVTGLTLDTVQGGLTPSATTTDIPAVVQAAGEATAADLTTTNASIDAVNQAVADVATKVNAAIADTTEVKKLVNRLIDILQTAGLAA